MKHVRLSDVACESVSHDADIMKQVLLGDGDLPASVRLSHALFKPGQKASEHLHANLVEVFYLLSGSGVVTINGKAHAVSEGSSIRIDAGERHEIINNGSDDLRVLYFALNSES